MNNLSAAVRETVISPRSAPFTQGQDLQPSELVDLAAADSIFFAKTFFSKTVAQQTPHFHMEMWQALDDPEKHSVGVEVFRGGAKTTIARLCIAKRISYGISRTILAVSASVGHSERTVRWLRKQIETNSFWTSTFGLRKGAKWTDNEIEIVNELTGFSCFVLAVGITGQIRGINLEDRRPDFILADDPCDEENSGTQDQREKTAALFFGALAPGLAPRSEVPWSKIVLLQTSIHGDDLISKAHKDPTWKTVKYGIFKDGESAWPERWSTQELMEKKEGYTRRGQLHLWLREYECEITSPENAPLKIEWLQYYEATPQAMVVYFGIDPAREKSKQPHKACIVAIGKVGKKAYLLDYFSQKSVNPEEIWTAFYTMAMRWRPYMTGVETIAYQQALAWYFRKRMGEVGTFWQIREVEDKRKKRDRIVQELTGLASEGNLYVRPNQDEWITAFKNWRINEDSDILDATALALALGGNLILTEDEDDMMALPMLNENNIKDLEFEGSCP